jgi:hypothetical protein
LQAVCSTHLSGWSFRYQLLKLHVEDPGVGTEVAKPSLELLAPPPPTSGLSPVHVGLMAGAAALSGAAVMVYLKRSHQLWSPGSTAIKEWLSISKLGSTLLLFLRKGRKRKVDGRMETDVAPGELGSFEVICFLGT